MQCQIWNPNSAYQGSSILQVFTEAVGIGQQHTQVPLRVALKPKGGGICQEQIPLGERRGDNL